MYIIQFPPWRHRSLLPPRRRHLHLCHIQILEIAHRQYPIPNIQSPISNRPYPIANHPPPIAFMVPPHDDTSCLLCPLPTGSPMTPASWGVRRMLFGYSSHSRWLSCARRWFAEYPPPLHSTPYALHRRSHHLSCTRRWLAVSPVFPCQSVLVCGRYISPPPVVFCQWSGNILASFLSLPLAVMLSRISPRVSPPLHPTLYALRL